MMDLLENPIVLQTVGDNWENPTRIGLIIWEGSTTVGDTVTLLHGKNGDDVEEEKLLWPGRTDTTDTYIGAHFGPFGLNAPRGFHLSAISAGRVVVYLMQS